MPIAIDFETYLISEEQPIPKPVCLSYYYGEGQQGLVTGSDSMEAFLLKILSGNEKIIAHNMAFEANVIMTHFPKLYKLVCFAIKEERLICTKIIAMLQDNLIKKPKARYSLAALVQQYFNEDISEDKKNPDAWRLRYNELDGVPLEEWPEEAVKYAIDDSKWAFDVYNQQSKHPVSWEKSVEADIWLNRMGLFGMEVLKERTLELEEELTGILTPLYKKLEANNLVTKSKQGKFKKNVKALRELVEETVETPHYTAKGGVSTSGEHMEIYLSETEDERFGDYLEVMKYEKFLTAFIPRLKQANPCIRTQYKACVSSGRTSSSTSTSFPSINIQQLPRTIKGTKWDIRNCVVPRQGFKLCAIDYAGLELASCANQLWMATGYRDMLNILNSGTEPTDMHSMLAYRIYNMQKKKNITYEFFKANKKEPEFAEFRQLAKPINLGFPGGIGYDVMRGQLAKEGIYPKLVVLEHAKYETSISHKVRALRSEGYPVRIRRTAPDRFELIYDELVALKQTMLGLYPDLAFFLQEGHESYLTGEKKWVKNKFDEWEEEPMYRYETGGFVRDWCQYTQVCNGLLMQSPSAIGAKGAVSKVMQKYDTNPDVNPLAFIHDEIVLEIREDTDMEAYMKDVSYIMIDEMQKVLPHVRITVEGDLMDYWMKSGGFLSRTYWKNSKNSLNL